MKLLTPEILVNEITYESRCVTHAVSIIRSTVSLVKATFFFCRTCRKILNTLNKLEKLRCESCDKICFSSLIPAMKDVIKAGQTLITLQEQARYPSFVIRMEKNFIADIENKIENYFIAVDQEIRDLAFSVEKKMNQIHAIR
jgi:hypothetical protein